MVTRGDPFDGILRTAAEIRADLIVMGPHRKQLLLDIFTGTTIERVIRKNVFPVLMVNHEAQRAYNNVVAPIDISGASANALRVAVSTGLIGDEGATLLHGFLALGKRKMFVAGSDQRSIDNYVASERRRIMQKLESFLAANGFNRQWSLRVDEGEPVDVISRVVAEMRPDLLVMGTRGRSRLLKAFIGSVTEAALRSLNVDILAVPPAKR